MERSPTRVATASGDGIADHEHDRHTLPIPGKPTGNGNLPCTTIERSR